MESQIPVGFAELMIIPVCLIFFGGMGIWIASLKSRSGGEGFALGCLLGPLGLLIEALMPAKPGPPVYDLVSGEVRAGRAPCPFCAEIVAANAVVCRFCGRDIGSSRSKLTEQQLVGDATEKVPFWARPEWLILGVPAAVLVLLLLHRLGVWSAG